MEQPGYNIISNKDIEYGDGEIISPEGSRNRVFRAMWTSPEGLFCPVAAKVCAHFKKEEGKILARLRHKNIITLCGIVEPNGPPDSYVIVTEYAEKGSLHNLIAQNRDNWSEYKQPIWLKWGREGAEALQFIHQMGHQHGDVKSPNFVITSDDTMKICDFGTVRQHVHTVTTHSTRGSWPWMAPEAMGLKGHPKITAKSDVFSFAVVLWELITGQEPFPGQCPPQIIQTVADNKERLEIPRDCPKHFSYLLTKCWAPEYKQRPSMEEVLECLVNHEEDMAAETHNAGSCEHQNPHQEQRLATEAVQTDKPDLSDKFFLRLSTKISTTWDKLAINLEFPRAEVDAYKANNMGDVVMQCHTMLVDWRNKQENMEEARQVLRDALVEIGRNDLAQEISDAAAPVDLGDPIYYSISMD